MNHFEFKFVTDTATMCIFVLACLKHRLSDDVDWWSLPTDELDEVNKGNVVFINLGDDGKYVCTIEGKISDARITVNFSVKSGRVFLVAAEDVTGDGMEPEGIRGGVFIELAPGG